METVLTSEDIGARLRRFRKRKGLTQKQLADKMGVTSQLIQQFENGKTKLNTDKLQAASFALSVPIAVFFKRRDVKASLSEEEQMLIDSFRALASPEVRSFVLRSLADAK